MKCREKKEWKLAWLKHLAGVKKLILSGLGNLIAAWVINALNTISCMTLILAILENMIGGPPRFFGRLRKADVRIKTSFAFIEISIYPSRSFKAGVVLNYDGLVYLKAFQQ